MTLFYSATHTQWLMKYTHLVALGQWHGMTASVCLTLLAAMVIINLLATMLTALFASYLNRRLQPKHGMSLSRWWG
ncbi:MAG: hypothetical protein ACRCWW_07355 [Scandinavium sp.]|uniref:hypothetical protein n=1 Tax=Scandinavium sp. TaxID=2830653 RepID=UPI003F332B75